MNRIYTCIILILFPSVAYSDLCRFKAFEIEDFFTLVDFNGPQIKCKACSIQSNLSESQWSGCFDSLEKEIKEESQKLNCLASRKFALNAMASWSNLFLSGKIDPSRLFLLNPRVDDVVLNLPVNLELAKIVHEKRRNSINELLVKYRPDNIPSDMNRLRDLRSGFQKELSSLLISINQENHKIYNAQLLLIKAKETLSDLENWIFQTGSDAVKLCEQLSLAEDFSLLNSNIKLLKTNIDDFTNQLAKMRKVESDMLTTLSFSLSMYLNSKYLAITASEIDDLRLSLFDLIRLDKLASRVFALQAKLSKNGIANDYHLKYLQYATPLRMMRTELGLISQLQVELQKIKSVDSQVKQPLTNVLASLNRSIEAALLRLETSSWKGQLAEQLFFLDLVNEHKADLSDKCLTAAASYKIKADQITTLSEYLQNEDQFVEVVDSCQL